ncbi:hypothetical protein FB45DRAFT_794707 [Roridomyces roridus]|uniref:Uncharacterized protein n=1 Tax=Roridomyces roridus TaxID=1738132 RepID=A0AAD7BRL5_9AGAR|nr:hypothetical protein FB45DRAFT_794707 [Roridomyces roridus]
MRRTQSVRNHGRPSLAITSDDLGVLREGNESNEDVLRRQLIDKDRENDRLKTQIEALQAQLANRPALEAVQQLQKDHRSLELILDGTQRENERCMAELERGKAREKVLEQQLTNLLGDNWQSSLDIPAVPPSSVPGRSILHQRSNTLVAIPTPAAPETASPTQLQVDQQQATLAHIEQIRMLIMGMEQRLQTREEKLDKSITRAESEGRRFEELRKGIAASE